MLVYQLKNNITGKSYIGQTKDLEKRMKAHKSNLRRGIHPNKELLKDFNNYGEEAFECKVIVDDLEQDDADIIEEALISTYYDSIYNVSKNSHGGDNISYHPDLENIKEKQRQLVNQRYAEHPEIKEKFSKKFSGENNPMYGRHHSEESRKKMSETRRANPKIYTEEERREISIKIQKTYDEHPEIKEKLSKSLKKAYENNDELRQKISKASKEHWQDPIIREKMISAARENSIKRRKRIMADGVEYPSLSSASDAFGLTTGAIINRCRSETYPGWYYIDD